MEKLLREIYTYPAPLTQVQHRTLSEVGGRLGADPSYPSFPSCTPRANTTPVINIKLVIRTLGGVRPRVLGEEIAAARAGAHPPYSTARTAVRVHLLQLDVRDNMQQTVTGPFGIL